MATPDEIRLIIRDVLTEEVANLKRPTVNEERVVIASDGDLTRFVARLLDLAADAGLRREIAEGRYVFRARWPACVGPGSLRIALRTADYRLAVRRAARLASCSCR